MDLERSIRKAYRTALARGWDTLYVLVDVHDTVSGSNYKDTEAPFFPEAIEALRELSSFPEVCLVLWTCCYPKDFQRYGERFSEQGVQFKHFNKTPVENTKTGDFTDKPYFSVLIDDKAGFDPADWPEVARVFREARSDFLTNRNCSRENPFYPGILRALRI
jgi:hypothetical protein